MGNKTASFFKKIFLIVIASVVAYLTYLALFEGSDEFVQLETQHFKAIIGIPAAFLSSLFLILLLKQSEKPIEFKGLSLEFRGTSGEIILWIACFLAITHAINALW